MKLFRLIPIFIAFMMLNGCVPTQPLSKQFYNAKTVGIIMQIDSIGMAKAGSQGLLDMAFTPGNRFKEPLQKVEAKLNLKDTLIHEINSILNSKNKQYKIIDENLIVTDLPKFEKPKSEKKYSRRDFRELKSKYNVDEIFVIKVRYGLLVSYYGFIETGKQGYVNIATEIVDLSDNSLLESQVFQSVANIKGNWKKGEDYANLYDAIQEAIDNSINNFKTKFK